MTPLPILYKAVVFKKRTRSRIEGDARSNFDEAFDDARTLMNRHDPKVALVLRSSPHPVNAGYFYLHWILK